MPDIKDDRFVTSMFPLMQTQGAAGFDSIKRSEIKAVVNGHLKMLLLVNPGEIISDINFGVGLYQHLFLNENEPKILNLKSKIVSQITKYLPYLKNFVVKVDRTKLYENKLAVRIEYSLTEDMSKDTLDFIIGEDSPIQIMFDDGGSTPSSPTVFDVLRDRT